MLNRPLALTAGLIAVFLAGTAAPRPQNPPDSLPHDAHQGVTVSVDPYLTAERYKAKFGKKRTPYDSGILALEIFARNDNDKPIQVNLNTVSLLVSEPGQPRQEIAPLSPEEVAGRVLSKNPRDPKAQRLPLPLPGGVPRTGKGKEWDELVASLRAAALSTDLLPPNATVHGCIYFDVDHHYDWISNAKFEFPDLQFMLDKKALFFFEIDLAPAAH